MCTVLYWNKGSIEPNCVVQRWPVYQCACVCVSGGGGGLTVLSMASNIVHPTPQLSTAFKLLENDKFCDCDTFGGSLSIQSL